MAGVLGKCPTCNGVVSTNSKSCPHCGEVSFKAIVLLDSVVKCARCEARGTVEGQQCSTCKGSGACKGVRFIDLRTGETTDAEGFDWSGVDIPEVFCPRPTSWGAPSSSGCAVIMAALLSVACALLVALFL